MRAVSMQLNYSVLQQVSVQSSFI